MIISEAGGKDSSNFPAVGKRSFIFFKNMMKCNKMKGKLPFFG